MSIDIGEHRRGAVDGRKARSQRLVRRKRERRDLRNRPTVSAIIPTLNEAANLPHVLEQLPNGVNELIVVDGHSKDDTIAVAQRLRPDARIVLQDRTGKGNALACGFAAARGDIIVMIDADGSTDPAEIPSFIRPLIHGADFVKGSRYLDGGGSADITGLRSLGNRLLGAGVNLMFGTSYTDLCYGYSAFWRRVLPRLYINCDGFEVETLLNVRAAKAGFKVVEVPSFEQERIHGLSNLNAWRDGRRVLRTILSERLSPLPEPGDEWMPPYAELGEVAARVMPHVVALSEDASREQRRIYVPKSHSTVAAA
ncbi:MAG: glycosyltransferase family 2 protein [Acidobacteriota bacterium]|nr:glycosyltransferase family 2 protein [Acidobacteriota bacterium]